MRSNIGLAIRPIDCTRRGHIFRSNYFLRFIILLAALCSPAALFNAESYITFTNAGTWRKQSFRILEYPSCDGKARACENMRGLCPELSVWEDSGFPTDRIWSESTPARQSQRSRNFGHRCRIIDVKSRIWEQSRQMVHLLRRMAHDDCIVSDLLQRVLFIFTEQIL